LQEPPPAQHRPGVAQERLEQRELLRRQLDLDPATGDPARRWAEPKIAGLKRHRPLPRTPPRQRAQAPQQHDEPATPLGVRARPVTGWRVASVAVSMSTGAHAPAARSARHVSKPSIPGSRTSRTIASYALAPARTSASSPRPTASTALARRVRPRSRSAAIFG